MPNNVNFNINILIVDDFNTVIKILTKMLNKIGFSNIQSANDGLVAWKKLGNEKIDLVITDWHMENSGVDLIKKIRASKVHKKIPVLIMSAEADHVDFKLIEHNLGNTQFVSKPILPATILNKIEQALNH